MGKGEGEGEGAAEREGGGKGRRERVCITTLKPSSNMLKHVRH